MDIIQIIIWILIFAAGFYLGWVLGGVENDDVDTDESSDDLIDAIHNNKYEDWVAGYHRRYFSEMPAEETDLVTQYIHPENCPPLMFVNGHLVWDHIPEEKREETIKQYRQYVEKYMYKWSNPDINKEQWED